MKQTVACSVCIIMIAIVSALEATQAQDTRMVKLFNGKTVTQEEYNETLRLIEKIISNVGEDAYRKYSDGSVAYLGKMMYIRYGIIPRGAYTNTNGMMLIDFGYTVRDVAEDGCRISPTESPYQDPEHDSFVVGLTGYSDRKYGNILMLRRIGDYTYTTTAGGSRTIPRCEIGKRATKEEYLKFHHLDKLPEPQTRK